MDKSSAEEQTRQALITALRLLTASPKSDQELRKKLAAKGYPEEILERALNELKAQGVLDDRAYAKDLMARLTLGKAAGRHKIAFEMKRHGIPQKIRQEMLGTLTNECEASRALEQARLKWADWSKLEPQKRKKRLYDFLIRKGYDFQIAQDILQKLTRDTTQEEI